MATKGVTMGVRLDVVGFVVKDMSASLAFYRRLGLDVSAEAEAEAKTEDHVETTVAGGLRVTWDSAESIRSFDPDWTPPTGGGAMRVAFLCDSPLEVDQQYRELVAAGYQGRLEPWDAVWGQRYAVVVDPDGNHVDLFARQQAHAESVTSVS
jgi:catechol 2,3-dioxygenase-like lactoylglutathione lyase family enzyme